MHNEINFGIGFVTGRPNVCKIINSYYKNILKQGKEINKKIKFTFYILYDLQYQEAKREEFYQIKPEVYNNKDIEIKYITPEIIEQEKQEIIKKYNIKSVDIELLLGHGHAKGRNTIMYFALKQNIDYLLFWDDDEYPVASILQENKKIKWEEQNNISEHIKNIENADVTIGHHCGYISPIPYVELGKDIDEDSFRQYIEAISNDIISWENIKNKIQDSNGVTFANPDIIKNKKPEQLKNIGVRNSVAGSTLCLNLRKYKNIPAFYNPVGARGEDTFFSANLTQAKVIRVPIYHFHDGFLKYTTIMDGKYPETLRKIKPEDKKIEYRFYQASIGWMKYKPLLLYIENKEKYKQKDKLVRDKLTYSIPKINKLFKTDRFDDVLKAFNMWSSNVEEFYKDFIKTNKVWEELKRKLKE